MPRELSYSEAIALAEREGGHPLRILLQNMTALHRAAQLARTPERQLALMSKAAEVAAKALPFCLPKMDTIQMPPE
jgi:hypothetical protein